MKINIYLNFVGILGTSILSALFTTGNVLAAPGYDEQGCNDLNFMVEVSPRNPQSDGSVEVAGVGINEVVADLNVSSISGTCNTGFDYSPPGTGAPGKGFVVYEVNNCLSNVSKDRDGIVGMFCLGGNSGILEFSQSGDNVPTPLMGKHAFTLQKKDFIGRKEIDLRDITKSFSQLYTTWGNYDWRPKPVIAKVMSANANKLVLTYTPTCSANVNNVIFPGTPSPSAIINRTVDSQQANVLVQCNDILPKYSITIDSMYGIHSANDGVIKSTNSSVGYQLTWGGNLPNSGLTEKGNVKLLTPLILRNGSRPTGNNFNIPVDITPISLATPGKDVTPGPANAAMVIALTFN
ncbi:hypothetical protein KWI12_17465 [Citrobacter cronae]|uniref:hypothetical protein n=1 Tax=Citrobacter cronae TaxID=1748967 RepID=UPI0021CEAFDE|nr:hypothetical protein [Citrobacter cronae]MCU6198650.1 hypothetical protein [Citrobacter cronae]